MENENKVIIEALQRLKRNKDYQYLCTHLISLQNITESKIFDENLEHKQKESLIIKRNTIKNFIELPDDLILDFKWIEE